MKMLHITVILQSVLSAVQRNQDGVIPVGQHTPSALVDVQIADIPAHTVFLMERAVSAAIPVRTVIQKRYIPMKMSVRDITSTVM